MCNYTMMFQLYMKSNKFLLIVSDAYFNSHNLESALKFTKNHRIYSPAGDHCEIDVDECGSHPCRNGATCTDRIASFECQCQAGFEGDICEINIDDCVAQPCQNGATCKDEEASFYCVCLPGYSGACLEIIYITVSL